MSNISNHQIVYFSTSTCGPCKVSKPFVEKISKERGIDTLFYIVDKEEGGNAVAVQYNVRAVPTIVFFEDGKETYRRVGMVKEAEFNQMCDEHLPSAEIDF